jgi:hypothetical protein
MATDFQIVCFRLSQSVSPNGRFRTTLTSAVPVQCHFPWLQTLSSLRPLQLGAHRPQIGQGKQGDQLCRVLFQHTVVRFDVARILALAFSTWSVSRSNNQLADRP